MPDVPSDSLAEDLMIRIVSFSCSLRIVYTTSKTRLFTDKPSRLSRGSWCECATSSQSKAFESPKTVAASSNGTPCFSKLAIALAISQWNTFSYIH